MNTNHLSSGFIKLKLWYEDQRSLFYDRWKKLQEMGYGVACDDDGVCIVPLGTGEYTFLDCEAVFMNADSRQIVLDADLVWLAAYDIKDQWILELKFMPTTHAKPTWTQGGETYRWQLQMVEELCRQ